MRKLLSALLGLGLATSASAQLVEDQLRPWSEVEAVLEAPGTLKFDSAYQTYWLARDGRLVTRMPVEDEEDAQMLPASLGTWRSDGAWLTIENRHLAYPSEAALAQARKEWDDYRAQMEAQADTAEEQAELAEVLAESEAEATDEASEDEASSGGMRLLRVPYAGGELLLGEWSLKSIAAGWDGQGPLTLMPVAWRVPAAALPEPDDEFPTFGIENPLAAGLPIELAALLRRDAIQGSVVEVLDTPETLKWSAHQASVRLKLDRGSHHGLYEDMDLYGLPPDEGFFAQVSEVKGEEAIARIHVSRFSAADTPELPTRGLRFTTRREAGTGCHVDTSAAVRGKVLSVASAPKQAVWDKDGFAFVAMTIDQGARHGLMAGDTLGAELDDIDGAGRVEKAEAERATVLWRVQRYGEDDEIRWPAAGDALVTPAWQREAWDAFGSDAE
jgi:hypothetical protein